MSKRTQTLKSRPQYDTIKKYYGQTLQKSSDLQTNACCDKDALPDYVREVLPLINTEIKERYYGCSSLIPLCLEGLKILDLGCGTGRDCYVMSKLAGEQGRINRWII